MKFKTLALVAAIAPSFASAGINPLPVAAGGNVAQTIYLAGSTALDRLTNRYIAGASAGVDGDVCVAGTQTWINTNPDAGSSGGTLKNAWGVACTAKPVASGLPAGLTAGVNYLFLKHGAGGSGSGTSAVKDSTALGYPPITATNCVAASATRWNCTDNESDQEIPTVGISDLNPTVFNGVNSPEVGLPFPAQLPAGFNVYPVAGAIFGIVANQPLYDALQAAQIAAGYLPGNCAASVAPECRPSLQRDVLKTLFTTKVTSWANVRVANQVISAAGVNAATSKICRRVFGSGTQAALNTFLETNGSFWGTDNLLPPLTGGNGANVHDGSGSGDVENCLLGYASGTQQSVATKVGLPNLTIPTVAGQKFFALGVLGLDRFGNEAAKQFRFIKIDGVFPSAWNAFTNKYPFWGTATVNCLAGNVFCNAIGGLLGAESEIGSLNNLTNPAFLALSSYKANQAGGNTCKTAFNPSLPTVGWTHTNYGTGVPDARRLPIPAWDTVNTTCRTIMPAAGDGNGTSLTQTYPDPR